MTNGNTMNKLKLRIHDEANGLDYVLARNCYIPAIEWPRIGNTPWIFFICTMLILVDYNFWIVMFAKTSCKKNRFYMREPSRYDFDEIDSYNLMDRLRTNILSEIRQISWKTDWLLRFYAKALLNPHRQFETLLEK